MKIDFDKCIHERDDGTRAFQIHARIPGTSLFAIARRAVEDCPVEVLDDAVNHKNLEHPFVKTLVDEALADLREQFKSVSKILGDK